MLNHPTPDLLHDLGLHGMVKGFRSFRQIRPLNEAKRIKI